MPETAEGREPDFRVSAQFGLGGQLDALQSRVTSLLSKYAGQPALRAVATAALGFAAWKNPELTPWAVGAQAADMYIIGRYEQDRTKKAIAFVDALDEQGFDLTEEEIDSEAFRDFFARTMACVLQAKRGEKIKRFAAITCNFRDIVWSNSEDLGEEIQRVLDSLSDREWQILVLLNDYELKRPVGIQGLEWASRFWQQFREDAEQKGIPADEFGGFITKLTATGCFVFFDVYGDDDGVPTGHTTPFFERLLVAVARKSGVYPHGFST